MGQRMRRNVRCINEGPQTNPCRSGKDKNNMIDYYLQAADTKVVKARKPHICFECCGRIEKGEKHTVHTGVGPDGWECYRHCDTCNELFDEVNYACPCFDDRPAYGELSEYLENSINYLDKKGCEQRNMQARFLRNKRKRKIKTKIK